MGEGPWKVPGGEKKLSFGMPRVGGTVHPLPVWMGMDGMEHQPGEERMKWRRQPGPGALLIAPVMALEQDEVVNRHAMPYDEMRHWNFYRQSSQS